MDTRETGSQRDAWPLDGPTYHRHPIPGRHPGCAYYLIGDVIAQQVVGFTGETVMQGIYEPLMRGAVESLFPADSPIAILLAGEFGLPR